MAVATSSCGPDKSYQVGVQGVPGDVLLGQRRSPSALPPIVPGANPQTSSPGFLVPPAVVGPPVTPGPTLSASPSASPPAPACPKADPLAAAKVPVSNEASAAPKPGVYHYRQSGFVKIGANTMTLPATTDIRIVPAEQPRAAGQTPDPRDNGIYWNMIERAPGPGGQAGESLTTTFRLERGKDIRISAIRNDHADGTVDAFTPANENVGFLNFPANDRAPFSGQAVDAVHQVSYHYAGAVAADIARIDACGTPIDAWRVNVPGQATAAEVDYLTHNQSDYTIEGHYEVATQYGGLIVAEELHLKAKDGSFEQVRTLVINSVDPTPLPAK
jgi:hypothetical protein